MRLVELENGGGAGPVDERLRRRHREDPDGRRAKDDAKTGAAARDETCLVARAVVGLRGGEHDVADAEGVEPGQVRARVQVSIEDAVSREVVLPEPAARERDFRAG